MEMSTRGRYALRALLDVAFHEQQGPVSRSDIAARQGISADYIAQLFRSLASAGLVKGVKGPGGGYVLGRNPAAIRVGDIVRAVEGPIAAVYCAAPDSLLSCPRSDGCTTRQLWVELSQAITQFLDSVTLRDLCDRASVVSGEPEAARVGDQERPDPLPHCAATSPGV